MWSVQQQFTQLASAEAYKELLDKRNKSNCQYMIVVCPHIEGNKHLDKLVEYQLSKLNLKVA
jgi:acetoacetate decarboxylase